jgi:DNA-binding GntR family transcriptional regulator
MSRTGTGPKGRRRLRVTTSAASYEQVAAWLRGRILGGEFDRPGIPFPSGPKAALETGTSQHTVQQAFGVLVREGLIQSVPKRGMVVLPRQPWAVGFRVRGDGDTGALVTARAAKHPAVSGVTAERDGDAWAVRMTVESSGAGRAADTAEMAIGPLSVLSVSAAEA